MRRRELIALSMLAAVATTGCPYLLGVEGTFDSTTGGNAGGGADGVGAGGPGTGTGGGGTGGGGPGAGGMGGATTTTGPGGGGQGGWGDLTVLVDESEEIDHIAVNTSHVYWIAYPAAGDTEARRVAKTGGTPEMVLMQGDLIDLAITDDVLVAASASFVYRRPIAGATTPQDWADTLITSVTVNATKIYYVQEGYIRQALHTAASPVNFEPEDTTLTDIVAGLNFVYWTIDGGARRVDHANTPPTQDLPSPAAGLRIAVDGEHACWTTAEAGHVYCWSPGDAAPRQVTTNSSVAPTAIALFGGDVYWTELSTGRVARTLMNGTGPVTELSTSQQEPTSIAVDISGVYWTNRTPGQVMHLPF